jgi:hypothetical protein
MHEFVGAGLAIRFVNSQFLRFKTRPAHVGFISSHSISYVAKLAPPLRSRGAPRSVGDGGADSLGWFRLLLLNLKLMTN